jgi:hypothetical protein
MGLKRFAWHPMKACEPPAMSRWFVRLQSPKTTPSDWQVDKWHPPLRLKCPFQLLQRARKHSASRAPCSPNQQVPVLVTPDDNTPWWPCATPWDPVPNWTSLLSRGCLGQGWPKMSGGASIYSHLVGAPTPRVNISAPPFCVYGDPPSDETSEPLFPAHTEKD